ncbi:MAG TPA: ABC transporter permease subunit, partial [Gemmataceae bacterium]|nr:ABC transporter permease subunit [Gemmataceae bacterium]
LLRDLRLPLFAVGTLLLLFQALWARITQRIVGEIAPYIGLLAGGKSDSLKNFANVLFAGPGKVIQTLIGGENIQLDRAMDILSIGYVHPVMQFVFCIWAVGRAAGAIAGEIDRGTMELLLAQPLARRRVILAHFYVDLLVIPALCLCLWAGNWLGYWLVGPIHVEVPDLPDLPIKLPPPDSSRLHTDPMAFGPALIAVASLIFAVSGVTMWLSARGRFRWRVLGAAVFLFLVQFLVNLIGQMWPEAFAWARPLTVFYYYQPQQIILGQGWEPAARGAAVLFGVGVVGYALALWTFTRRDVPAPL